MKEVSIDDLVGEHLFDGVDIYVENVKTYGDNFDEANVILFRLDGVVYVAFEDPSDGYRSSMDRLIVSPSSEMTNIFPAIRVLARKKNNGDWQNNDTLELIDMITGKVVMEVGTDNYDDYYPSFVSNFRPENMVTNKDKNIKRQVIPPRRSP
jgi:hypothetical protein